MDILQLEHFQAVAEDGSFTRAAQRMCRTQPAISQSIKKLEDELGTALFTRDLHEVALTDAGKALMVYARQLIATRDQAARTVGALKHHSNGTLNIAAHESAATYLLPPALRHYLHAFPDMKVGIFRSRLADIPRRVLDRTMHIGFVTDEPEFKELTCVPVYVDEMVLIASPDHPLAHYPSLLAADLDGEPFVLHRPSSTTEHQILAFFDEHHVRPRFVAEVGSFNNIKHLVEENVGLAIVPRVTVSRELATGALVRINVGELNIARRSFMIYRQMGRESNAARELIEVVRGFNWHLPAGAAVRLIRRRA